jgi:molybdate transport system substrate-binding protein
MDKHRTSDLGFMGFFLPGFVADIVPCQKGAREGVGREARAFTGQWLDQQLTGYCRAGNYGCLSRDIRMKILCSFGAAVGLVLLAANPASSDELKIFGSRVTRMVVDEIGPQFEQATGHHLVVVTDVAAALKRRIEAGEAFDLAVLVNFQADDLIKQGKLAADTRADIMKAGIGVAARRGAPIPDISTVDAFKATLLAAKSITYLKEGASTIYLDRLFAGMGIADALRPKTTKPETESVSEAVAAGDVELGLIVIPNILSVPGAQLVGPIPEAIQSYIVFTAAVAPNSPNQQAARDLIAFLRSPAAIAAINAKGMSPG